MIVIVPAINCDYCERITDNRTVKLSLYLMISTKRSYAAREKMSTVKKKQEQKNKNNANIFKNFQLHSKIPSEASIFTINKLNLNNPNN